MDSKVSIIVPIYNTEKYLKRCVDSILAQSYENLEVILIDDGSKDNSPAICDDYAKKDNRIVVVHKQNGGLSSARNAGLNVATGDYIGFVDSDDFISPNMYKKLIENIDKSGKTLSNVMYVRSFDSGKVIPSKVPHTTDEEIYSEQFTKELMLHTGDVSVCTKLFPKEIFDNVRFCEDKLNEDLLFILKILNKIEKINFVGEIGYYYFLRSGSISSGYGKAVEDMVGNSVVAMETVVKKFPQLKMEAVRFALYQHMAYLLLLPLDLADKENALYVNAIKFIRKHYFKNIFNKYLTFKNKVILFAFSMAPKLTKRLLSIIKK